MLRSATDGRFKPRLDSRKLTEEQVSEVRASDLSGPAIVRLLRERDGVSITSVAIWKIRHNLCYKQYGD